MPLLSRLNPKTSGSGILLALYQGKFSGLFVIMDPQARSMHTHSLCALTLLSNLENLTLGPSLALLQQEQRDFESSCPSLLPASLFSHMKCEDNYWLRSYFFSQSLSSMLNFLLVLVPRCP